jgi:hypothetical protein
MATLYRVEEINGAIITTKTEVSPKNGISFHLPELYKMLDCSMIEVVYPQNPKYSGKILIIDEEGKLTDKSLNLEATRIFGADYDVIVGSALLCDDSQLQ